MTSVVVGSVRGAPGVTTVSLLMASCMGGAVAEADVDGGVLAARYRLGREPGMTTWAASRSRGPDEWRQHAQTAGRVPVLVGPDAPQKAVRLWASAGEDLASAVAASGTRIVVDAGRIRPESGHETLLRTASLVVLLVRPVLDDLLGLTHRLPILRDSGAKVGLGIVGTGAYGPEAVARQFNDMDVLAVLPQDRRAAALLDRGGTATSLARTRLARAVRTLTEAVIHHVGEPTGRRELMAPSEQRKAPA
jgi:hypothetical protein